MFLAHVTLVHQLTVLSNFLRIIVPSI